MKLASALLVLAVAAPPAHADRVPILAIGGGIDFRFTGHTWSEANKTHDFDTFGGLRATLSFEPPPLPLQRPHVIRAQARLVPELFLGASLGKQLGEGYGGAGLRGELHLASWKLRTSIYVAARAVAIGLRRDGAVELAFGEFIVLPGNTRFGWEGGAVIRSQDRAADRELGCVANMYVAWPL